MRITFFGSSHGLPETHRRCSCILLTVGEGEKAVRYFIDMGCMAMEELSNRGIAPSSVRSIFITHKHGDHTNGLLSYVDLCSWYYRGHEFDICLPDIEQAEAIKTWVSSTGVTVRDDIHFHEVTDGFVYDDGLIRVSAYRTKHSTKSYAYLVEAEGKRVLFTGDLSHAGPADDFPTQTAKDSPLDLVVCECAHFGAMSYAPIFKSIDVGRVIINHYAPGRVVSVYELIAEMKPTPVSMANDGLEIEL